MCYFPHSFQCCTVRIGCLAAVIAVSASHLGHAQTTGFVARGSLPGQSSSGACVLEPCRVVAINDVQVPALEDGALVEVRIDDGQLVQKGEILARIDDHRPQLERRAAQKELDAAETRAADDISVRAAEAEFETADAELQQGLALNAKRRSAVSASEIRRRKLARLRAELGIDKARLDLRIAKMNAEIRRASLDVAEASVRRRQIVSPVDGLIMPIYRGNEDQRVCQVGQWVRAGEPVVRIIRMDRLYVEGLVSAAQYNPSELNDQPVSVTVQLAGGREEQFSGSIVYINPTLTTQNKYRVRAAVDNRNERGQPLLRPGSTARMTIELR